MMRARKRGQGICCVAATPDTVLYPIERGANLSKGVLLWPRDWNSHAVITLADRLGYAMRRLRSTSPPTANHEAGLTLIPRTALVLLCCLGAPFAAAATPEETRLLGSDQDEAQFQSLLP